MSAQNLTKKERKRLQDRERMDRFIAAVRRSNWSLLREMEAENYPGFDATVEDASTCSDRFLIWGAFHKAQCLATAGLFLNDDPVFVREFCQIGLMRAWELSRSEEGEAGESDDVQMAFAGVTEPENVGVLVDIRPETSCISNLMFEVKAGRPYARVRAAEETEKRMRFLFALGQNPLVNDQTGQAQWGAGREFYGAVHRTRGMVVTNNAELVVNDSVDHAPVEVSFCGRRHSRFCEIVHYGNRGTLVLALIMERSEEVFRQVTALANLEGCRCLEIFQNEELREASSMLPITLKVGETPEKAWEIRQWYSSYLITLASKKNLSWWIRVWTVYNMLKGVSTWEDRLKRLQIVVADPELPKATVKRLF